jgi:hypothetical protein
MKFGKANTPHLLFVFFTLLLLPQLTQAQLDYKERNPLKNTIKLNLTNVAIFGQSYILGYERILGNNQSVSINLGSFALPKLAGFNTDSVRGLSQSNDKSGYSLSLDYRFYLGKVNRYGAPRGIYIGPYFSHSQSKSAIHLLSDLEAFKGDLNDDFKFGVTTVGFQLGYQFVFWKRMSLDMILAGPGVSWYSIKNDLSTTLNPNQEAELFQKINDALAAKLPGYSIVVKPGSFVKDGSYKTTSLGYRYVIMVGFRF